jgi:hypothetical protein
MFEKSSLNFFSNSVISPNFYDFLYKCYHISVVIKYISKIPNVLTSWDVKLEVRMSFNKKIHTSARSEMFKHKKHILRNNFLTVRDKK